MPSLDVPAQAAKVGAQVMRERLRPRRVVDPAEVPPSADALTDEWLTGVLCRSAPGAAVTGHAVSGGSDGTSSRRAVEVSYNDTGAEAGLPTRLFAKSAASFQSRLFLVLGGVTEGEALFYRDIRPEIEGLRSPVAYHAASDSRRFRSILLMEDLASEGWSFPDPMAEAVSRSAVEQMVDQMALYHAAFWDDPRLTDGFPGLQSTFDFQTKLNAVGIEKRVAVGVERGRSVIPPRLYARRDEIFEKGMRSLRMNSSGTPTLLHQDVHQGNWMRSSDGTLGLYDWQATARGEWALDYAYALAVNLTVEDRRAWEGDLLARYLEQLAANGAEHPPGFEEAWLRYRQQPFHVLIFALFTIGASRLMPDMQPRDYMLRCLARIATFVDDHESLDSLDTSA